MRQRHEARYEEWSGTLDEWESTGLSGAAFCRERGIAYWKFSKWKQRLRRQKSTAADEAHGFVALGFENEAEDGCGVKVVVGRGVRLVLSKGFDETELARAIRVLHRSVC